ncbi:MAG: dehydratase [Agathobacter sp.]|nr:dehydratase [Agathobacter sp.]
MNKYLFEEINIGQKESFEVTVRESDMIAFREITGDVNPLHNDEDFAMSKGYTGRVVYGMLTSAYLSTLAGVYIPGERSLIQSVSIDLVKPVYIGNKLNVLGEVVEKSEAFSTIKVKVTITNEAGKKVLRGTMRIGVSE